MNHLTIKEIRELIFDNVYNSGPYVYCINTLFNESRSCYKQRIINVKKQKQRILIKTIKGKWLPLMSTCKIITQ